MILSSSVETITPEIARRYLETSAGNRHVRPTNVAALAGAMRRGEWKVSHQGIAFDSSGSLRDGHHRLSAVIESGVSVPMMVTRGLSPEATEVMDIGAKRTLGDALGLVREESEVVNFVGHVVLGPRNATTASVKALPCFQMTIHETRALMEFCNSRVRYFTSVPMRLAAVMATARGEDREYVHSQYRAMALADYNAMSDVAQSLHRALARGILSSKNKMDAVARGLSVFDKRKSSNSKIQVKDGRLEDVRREIIEFSKLTKVQPF